MKLDECLGCRYCVKRWEQDQYGREIDGYYGCDFQPYWYKHIGTIEFCPKKKKDTEIYHAHIACVDATYSTLRRSIRRFAEGKRG